MFDDIFGKDNDLDELFNRLLQRVDRCACGAKSGLKPWPPPPAKPTKVVCGACALKAAVGKK